jgi:hypothetical protein
VTGGAEPEGVPENLMPLHRLLFKKKEEKAA